MELILSKPILNFFEISFEFIFENRCKPNLWVKFCAINVKNSKYQSVTLNKPKRTLHQSQDIATLYKNLQKKNPQHSFLSFKLIPIYLSLIFSAFVCVLDQFE